MEAIRQEGLHTSVGGYINQHDDEPGVNLTTCSSTDEWNSDIFYLARPVRIEIDTSQLDAALLGPDLNSMLDENCVGDMEEQGMDAEDPHDQTWANSLAFTGNCRYLAEIPPQALCAFESFKAPRDWKMQEAEAEFYGQEPEASEGRVADANLLGI